jgi:hypothetical protein
MPKYRKFIEENFNIDEAQTGKLVPFVFNKVQARYYEELVKDYDIEKKGVSAGVREIVLKARREGFSSLILALFAADDILQDNPTETSVISYKDDATKTFSKRYRVYVTSFFEKHGVTDPRKIFRSDNGNELILAHNGARFYCGTASARVAGRGGVLQKLLFSEAAHYPDSEKMMAREIIDGTLRQVDINSGWAFMESTANGFGNYFERIWSLAVKAMHRFKARFYGWRDFYTEEQFKLIASEFADKSMLKQEYPETPEEAFISSGSSFFDNELIFTYLKNAEDPLYCGNMENGKFVESGNGIIKVWEEPKEYASYTIGGDTAEGIEGGDYSVLIAVDNKTLKTVAKMKATIPPDEMSKVAYDLGKWYNNAYMGIEVNKDGLWVNTELFKMGYTNLYYREAIDDITNRIGARLGFKTTELTRPYILSELRKMLASHNNIWNNKEFLEECLVFVRNKMGRPEAMSGKNDDEIMATAIAYEIRRNAPMAFEVMQEQTPRDDIIDQRLEKLYGRNKNKISQEFYMK